MQPTPWNVLPRLSSIDHGNLSQLSGLGGGSGGTTITGKAQPTNNQTQPSPAVTYSGPSYDTQAVSAYDQSIGNTNAALGRLDNQLNVGFGNIDTAYNSSYNNLAQQKATGQRNYDTNKTQTAQDFVGAKNTIGSNAGNSLNSLQRLLGSKGAGGSSAYSISAPQAVGRQASIQRADAGQTFGKNNQALDTNWNDFLTGWNSSVSDLGRQRDDSRNNLQAQINTTRASLLQNLAQLMGQKASVVGGNAAAASQPYIDQANGLLSQADNLGRQTPVFQVAPVNYNAPDLNAYTVNPNAAPIQGNQTASTDQLSPYLSLLLGKKQNQLGAF